MAIKNLWSLNIDELLAADKIKSELKSKGRDVFFPLNSQLKGVDLVVVDLNTRSTKTIQVKGSRTYTPRPGEIDLYGAGATSWFAIRKKEIENPKNTADVYIFVLHCLVNTGKKMGIGIQYLIIPTKDLRLICAKKMPRKNGTQLYFFIWIDTAQKRAFDIETDRLTIPFEKYLNNWKPLVG